jgi:hypothetical protein
MSDAAQPTDYCYNCNIRLTGGFCANCGQKAQGLDPSLTHFLHDLTHELLHVDGKIVRSVWTLLARPGVLTRDYFEGRRARWISPIRLYLVFSVAYFAVTALLDDEGGESMHTASRLMFLLLPVFAWLVSVVAKGRRNFPQHLYFALHVHAAWFAAWLIREGGAEILSPRFMSSTRWLGRLMLLYSVVYAVLAFRTAYSEKFWKAALKMAGVIAAYVAAFALAGFLILLLNPGLKPGD